MAAIGGESISLTIKSPGKDRSRRRRRKQQRFSSSKSSASPATVSVCLTRCLKDAGGWLTFEWLIRRRSAKRQQQISAARSFVGNRYKMASRLAVRHHRPSAALLVKPSTVSAANNDRGASKRTYFFSPWKPRSSIWWYYQCNHGHKITIPS